MPRSPKSAPALASVLARVIGGRSVWCVDGPALRVELGANVQDLPPPDESGAIAVGPEPGALLVASLGAASPLAIARGAASRLPDRSVIAFALPKNRPGIRRLFGRKRREVPLEDLCEALLIAGLDRIQARELDAITLAWGHVRST